MRAWLLLLAFAPSLLFLGHWDIPLVPIPGTHVAIGIPFAEHTGAAGHDHASHCHEDSSECASSSPAFAGLSVALLGAVVALLGASAAFRVVPGALITCPAGWAQLPGHPPPRVASNRACP